ncbi:MAG: hypothetical protein ACK419_05920 [Pyrinomonadaceae bacterium]
MVGAGEVSQLLLAIVNILLEMLVNLIELCVEAGTNQTLTSQGVNLNFSNLWGILYGSLLVSKEISELANRTLYIISTNETAVLEIAKFINEFGKNATTIFGDAEGTKGIAFIQREVYKRLTSNPTELTQLTGNVADLMFSFVKLLVEMTKSIPQTFKL